MTSSVKFGALPKAVRAWEVVIEGGTIEEEEPTEEEANAITGVGVSNERGEENSWATGLGTAGFMTGVMPEEAEANDWLGEDKENCRVAVEPMVDVVAAERGQGVPTTEGG